jgi:hypothetical protein
MAIFLLVLGVMAILAGVLLGCRVLAVRSWPTVAATVTERGVGLPDQPTGGSQRARFVPSLILAYEIRGIKYVSTGRSLVQETMTEEEARAWVDAIPESPVIHYNPEAPGESYLEPGSLVLAGLALTLGLLAAAAGAIMLLSGVAARLP